MGPILATRLNAGFIPIRKPGKLPAETVSYTHLPMSLHTMDYLKYVNLMILNKAFFASMFHRLRKESHKAVSYTHLTGSFSVLKLISK